MGRELPAIKKVSSRFTSCQVDVSFTESERYAVCFPYASNKKNT